jgi:hypothetical protein
VQGGQARRARGIKYRTYSKGGVSEACVRVIDSAAQSQYRSVDPRHTFKGESQRIHASRFTNCCTQTTRPFAARTFAALQTRRQVPARPSPRRLHPRRHRKAWHVSLIHCYQHIIKRLYSTLTSRHLHQSLWQPQLTDDSSRHSHLPANFLFRARHLQTRSIPNFQKISMLLVGRHNITNGFQ